MTIREFVTALRSLAPLSVPQMMARFQLTEADAHNRLRNSWQPVLQVSPTDAVLDAPFPSPEQFSLALDFQHFSIGNISLNKEIVDWGSGFWAIGHIHQEMLLINHLDKRIYYADYDAFADHDYANFHPCARDFGSFLAALLYYCLYFRDFYAEQSDPQPLVYSKEELIAYTLSASGIEEASNILAELY